MAGLCIQAENHACKHDPVLCCHQHCICVCRELQQQYHLDNNRSIPQWGQEIFSDLCIIMRPSEPQELANFIKYTIALTQAHLQLSKQTSTVQNNR